MACVIDSRISSRNLGVVVEDRKRGAGSPWRRDSQPLPRQRSPFSQSSADYRHGDYVNVQVIISLPSIAQYTHPLHIWLIRSLTTFSPIAKYHIRCLLPPGCCFSTWSIPLFVIQFQHLLTICLSLLIKLVNCQWNVCQWNSKHFLARQPAKVSPLSQRPY